MSVDETVPQFIRRAADRLEAPIDSTPVECGITAEQLRYAADRWESGQEADGRAMERASYILQEGYVASTYWVGQ